MVHASGLTEVLHFLESGASVKTMDEFARFVVTGLPSVVRCDSVSYNEVDPRLCRLVSLMEPDTHRFAGDVELWQQHMHEHPSIAHYMSSGDGSAVMISDFFSQDEFHATALYRAVYRPLHTEFQMSVVLPTPQPVFVGVALNRETHDFDEHDRRLLNLVRPHLAELHHSLHAQTRLGRTLAALERAVARDDRAIVALTDDRRVALVSDRAIQLLARYAGPLEESRLPSPVRDWLERQTGAHVGTRRAAPGEALVIDRPPSTAVIRFLPRLSDEELDVITIDEHQSWSPADSLTTRERDVLRRVAEGRTNAQIAGELEISARTVDKHLQRIFAKLGVSTRTAAVAAVVRGAGS